MKTADPKVIRNRFKRSPLPPNWDIAEALRNGATVDEFATRYGVQPKTITRRLAIGGWDPSGKPFRLWQIDEPSEKRRACSRCGWERTWKAGRSDLCRDCTDVEKDLAEMEKAEEAAA